MKPEPEYYTSNDKFFLPIPKDDPELNLICRKKMDTDIDLDTGDLIFKTTMRFSAEKSDWNGFRGKM